MPPKRKTTAASSSSSSSSKKQRTAATANQGDDQDNGGDAGDGGDGGGVETARTAMEEIFLTEARKYSELVSTRDTAMIPTTLESAKGLCAVKEAHRAHWTQQDEDDLQARWDQSPLKKVIADHSKKGREAFGELLALWKYSIQVYGLLPTSIIGGQYNLRVDASGSQQSTLDDSPIWSSPVCKALIRIMAHPIFFDEVGRQGGANASTLATTLQLAVIARTADTRPWRVDGLGMDRFPTILNAEIGSMAQVDKRNELVSTNTTNCWRVVRRATDSMVNKSPLAVLFSIIIGKYEERRPLPHVEPVAKKPYVLTLEDLTCVTESLDEMPGWMGPSFAFSTAGYYALTAEAKKLGQGKNVNTAPSASQLHTLLAGGVVASWREAIISERIAAARRMQGMGLGVEEADEADGVDEMEEVEEVEQTDGVERAKGGEGQDDEDSVELAALAALAITARKNRSMGPLGPLEEEEESEDSVGSGRLAGVRWRCNLREIIATPSL
ncbi:hypothetical protein QBC39DRAFT_378380 [Podospora conica]|nr:hypothetical protein QBC39DRAFT_378380 [Schizothecium conicum]